MTDTIPVVSEAEAKDEAYAAGYDRFEGADHGLLGEPLLAEYTGTSEYAGHVLPELRALAGFEDRKGGTFKKEREVALVPVGSEDDLPAEAEVVSSHHVFEELVDCWHNGALDALSGDERGESK